MAKATEMTEEALEAMFREYETEGWDELDAAEDLVARGVTPGDLAYSDDRRRWFEEFAEGHGLI